MAAEKNRKQKNGAAALLTAAGMLLLLIALSSSIRQSRVFPEEVQQYRFLVEHYIRMIFSRS